MQVAGPIAAAVCLLAVVPVRAGTIDPYLRDRMDQMLPSVPMSAIVIVREQAPIARIDEALRARRATRQERHREVVLALQSAATTQRPLLEYLDQERKRGTVIDYAGFWVSNLVVVQATREVIETIGARGDVDLVEPGFSASPTGSWRGDTHSAAEEAGPQRVRGIGVAPGLRAIRAPEVWYGLGINGAGTIIGSIDTGVDGNHPALRERWRAYQGQHPWQECWLDVLGHTSFPYDDFNHGTPVMGVLGGLGVGTQDTIGVAWGARWIACNAIDQYTGPEFDRDIFTAIQWFIDPDGNPNTVDDVPDLVQNSWGVNEQLGGSPPYIDCDPRWWGAIDACEAAGIVLVFSAGVDGPGEGTVRSPADRATSATNTFSVGSVDADNYGWPYPIAPWSSRGPSGCDAPAELKIKPEVCAPGVDIYTCDSGGGYSTWSGTAFSGPHAAGIVSLLRQANPDLEVDAIKQILMETSRDEGPEGEDNSYGWGCVDAYAAVLRATSYVQTADERGGDSLDQSRPNPYCRGGTSPAITFSLSQPGWTRLVVHDVSGRIVRTLLHKRLTAGAHDIGWDGRDAAGRAVASGVYFYSLSTETGIRSRRLTVLN